MERKRPFILRHRWPTAVVSAMLLFTTLATAQTASTPPKPFVVSTEFMQPTPCPADINESDEASDADIVLRPDATLNVMFHGNRFVVADELVRAFEAAHPDQRISYTAIPPAHTMAALRDGSLTLGSRAAFSPDVVMGPPLLEQARSRFDGQPTLESRGLYSRVHGLVLMARHDDTRVAGTDWKRVVQDERLRLVIPGRQATTFTLLQAYAVGLAPNSLESLRGDPRVGASQMRHHRSIPARIGGRCEDVGVQYLQSKQYWERLKPGAFKYIPIPLADADAGKEDSFLYLVKRTTRKAAAEVFIAFMLSDQAVAILRRYDLAP